MQAQFIFWIIIFLMIGFFVYINLWPLYVHKKKSRLLEEQAVQLEAHKKEMMINEYSGKEFLCVNEMTDDSGPLGSEIRIIYVKQTLEAKALPLYSFDNSIRVGSRIKLRARTEEERSTFWSNDITRYLIPELMDHSPFHAKNSDNFEFWERVFEEIEIKSNNKIILTGEVLLISESAAMNGQEGFVYGSFDQNGEIINISCEYNGSLDCIGGIKFTVKPVNTEKVTV